MRNSKRVRFILFGVLFAITASVGGTAHAQASYAPTNNEPNLYKPGYSFGQLPNGRKWGALTGIGVDQDDHIWAFERCGGTNCVGKTVDPVVELDTSGKVLKAWGSGLFNNPHGIYVDKERNVWLVDSQAKDGKGSQVFKFTPDGKLLMTIGKPGVSGNGPGEFDSPNAVIIGRNGDIFVAQGHKIPTCENSSIVKFTKDGKFIKEFGQKGSGPGELKCPHSLTMDSKGRIFVADLCNQRVAIFDQDGEFIAGWKQFGGPTGVYIDAHDILYTADSISNDNPHIPGSAPGHGYNPGVKRGIRVGSIKNAKVTAFIPDPNPRSHTSFSEEVAADHEGNIYGAEVADQDLMRYDKKL